MEKNELKRLY